MTILDLSKVNVTLPSVEASLGASSSQLQLIVSGYVLAFGLALVPMGRLGDQRSRRTLFLVGLPLFAVMSAACALAQTPEQLLLARLAQGVAAGIQMPQVVGTIQQVFTGPARAKAFGLFGSVIGVSTAFGPTLGGLMIALGGARDGWRWVFWMNVPLALLVIAGVIWLLPNSQAGPKQKLSLDPVGILLFGVTVTALMTPFLLTTGASTDDPRRWWLLAVAALAAAVFVGWEGRYAVAGKAPLIPLKLFRISSFRNGTLVIAAYFSAIPAMFLLTTLFLQLGVGVEPVYAGMVSIGFALVSAVSAWYGGRLVINHGRPVVVVGLVVILAATVGMGAAAAWAPAGIVEWVMAGIMALAGAGGGLVVAPNQALTLGHVPIRDGGLAGSVGQLGQRIGTAIGSAVALAIFYATIYHEGGHQARDLGVFRDGYRFGMLAVSGFLALALLIALVDMGARRRAPRAKE
ncbi:MFS transporter [Rarobacter incanus]|nr:MFS transporter [Rarobacter incanus]